MIGKLKIAMSKDKPFGKGPELDFAKAVAKMNYSDLKLLAESFYGASRYAQTTERGNTNWVELLHIWSVDMITTSLRDGKPTKGDK